MEHIKNVSLEELQRALEAVDGKKPTQRLMVAIAYKNGVSQTELAEWYDVQRRTIYSWLKRLEQEPLEQAVYDDTRSGRPRKLGDEQQAQLEEALHEPPAEAGYDVPGWTPTLVQQYLEERFDVDYSRPSCRRLMKDAGLRYTDSPPGGVETPDSDSNEERDTSAGRWVPQ